MSWLGLANISSFAHWILTNDDRSQLRGAESWTSDETRDISSHYASRLQNLLRVAKVSQKEIQGIFVVTGPGSFTGLRNSSSFAIGLATSLKIALRGIPSFDLYQKSFYIPTRHQLAKTLNFESAAKAKLEFIHVKSAELSEVEVPQSAKDFIVGLEDHANWPHPQDFYRAISQAPSPKPDEELRPQLELLYGLAPKISGQR
jgi:hypothetical protein